MGEWNHRIRRHFSRDSTFFAGKDGVTGMALKRRISMNSLTKIASPSRGERYWGRRTVRSEVGSFATERDSRTTLIWWKREAMEKET